MHEPCRAPVRAKCSSRGTGACDGAPGITVEVFRSLLSHEDLGDIEGGDIPVETLHGYAQAFAEGMCSGRIAVPGGEP